MLGVVKERYPNASWKSDFSWSRINDSSVYDEFQELVRQIAKNEGVMPLEVDYLFWDE